MNKKTIIITAVAVILALAGVFSAVTIGQNRAGETGTESFSSVEEATVKNTSKSDASTPSEPVDEVEVEPESEEDVGEEELPEITGETKGGLAPEFKKFWDEYVEFMEKYVSVMNDPENEDYEKLTEKYSEYSEKAAEYESSEDLTDDEIHYMTDAQAKITALYADALLS